MLTELVLKGKSNRIALRLNNTENELKFGPTADSIPECDVMPFSMSLLDVDRVIVGGDVPIAQKMVIY